jgi:hypothetical protein
MGGGGGNSGGGGSGPNKNGQSSRNCRMTSAPSSAETWLGDSGLFSIKSGSGPNRSNGKSDSLVFFGP